MLAPDVTRGVRLMWENGDVLATRDLATILARALDQLRRDPSLGAAEAQAIDEIKARAGRIAAGVGRCPGAPPERPEAEAMLDLLERVRRISDSRSESQEDGTAARAHDTPA